MTCKIALVGDIHGHWQAEADTVALQTLGVDLALFVGDFGNEDVALTQAIAELPIPKVVILGNHDGWYTVTEWGRKKCPYDRQQENRVKAQLLLLGRDHVGYGWRDFPQWDISVVGGRPFSWGGQDWQEGSFYQEYYGIENMQASGERISEQIMGATCTNVILLGHNGPYGLGALPHDPCGKDWQKGGGDHGDPDLAMALEFAYTQGKHIPLVAFGHMHHQLKNNSGIVRRSIAVNHRGTVFVNGAIVPRVLPTVTGYHRCFTVIDLEGSPTKQVQAVNILWLDDQGQIVQQTQTYPSGESDALP